MQKKRMKWVFAFLCLALLVGVGVSVDASAKTVTKKVGKGKIKAKKGYVSVSSKTKKVSLKKNGTYTVTGTISGYSFVVTKKKANVKLVLGGTKITNSKTSCIYSKDKESTLTIQGTKGKKNTITGPKTYAVAKNTTKPELDAVVYSEGDITFAGSGSITVDDASNNGEGIHSKEKLTMKAGTLKAVSNHSAFHGEDVYVKGGTLQIQSGDKGIESKQNTNISGGTLNVTAGDKGIQGKTGVTISGGTVNVTVAKAAGSNFDDYRGIVAGQTGKNVSGSIRITGGTITVNSFGDCIRASKDVTISGGTFRLTSADDDGIQAKGTLTISGKPSLTIKAKGKKVKGEKENIASGIHY